MKYRCRGTKCLAERVSFGRKKSRDQTKESKIDRFMSTSQLIEYCYRSALRNDCPRWCVFLVIKTFSPRRAILAFAEDMKTFPWRIMLLPCLDECYAVGKVHTECLHRICAQGCCLQKKTSFATAQKCHQRKTFNCLMSPKMLDHPSCGSTSQICLYLTPSAIYTSQCLTNPKAIFKVLVNDCR